MFEFWIKSLDTLCEQKGAKNGEYSGWVRNGTAGCREFASLSKHMTAGSDSLVKVIIKKGTISLIYTLYKCTKGGHENASFSSARLKAE